jgi:uncharacterized membrane protein YqiK
MRRYRYQRGEGQGGCVVGLILLLIGIFIAYKLIPVKIKAAEMRQTVVDEAKMAGSRDNGRIMTRILQKADELRLPVTEKDVKINRGNNQIRIDVTYVVPIDFPGYKYNWSFHHSADNPIF